AAHVSDVLGQAAAQQRELEFGEQMAESQEANIASAKAALDAVMQRRGLTESDVQRASDTYLANVGVPLRTSLEQVPEADREQFVHEVPGQADVADESERIRRFKLSLFGSDSRDVLDGLKIAGGVSRDMPPELLDPAFHAHRTEQRVRARDAERAARPSRAT